MEGNEVKKLRETFQKHFVATAFTDVGDFDITTGSKETPSGRKEDAEGPCFQSVMCKDNTQYYRERRLI